MKVLNLTRQSAVYTSNVYLVLGSWNALPDMNTLVDVGRDPGAIDAIKAASTGIGKKRVAQVVLTHCHYDHCELLPKIRAAFDPVVYAFSRHVKGVDRLLEDGDRLRIGDRIFEALHVPGHSQDSICLYCEEEKVLFSGDAPLIIRQPGQRYQKEFVRAVERISRKDVRAIYPGHGPPLLENCQARLHASLRNVGIS